MKSRLMAFAFMSLVISCSASAKWEYETYKDDMTDETIKIAFNNSENSEPIGGQLKSEYKMQVFMRNYPGKGNALGLTLHGKNDLDKAYYMCTFQTVKPCTVTVRFDQNKPEEFVITPPESGGDDVMYFYDSERFYSKLKESDSMKIRASFFQSGDATFNFKTEKFHYN